jgi:hypothetical protein
MTFYFERSTGKRVSESTWKRSKAQGGSRFVRRSATPTPREDRERGSKALIPHNNPAQSSLQGTSAPSQSPRTYQEWQEQARKKFKKHIQYDDFDFDNGVEYETGVDY